MNKIYPLVISITFSLLLCANALAKNSDWDLYYQDEKVKIEQQKITCSFSSTADREIIIFRIQNLTSEKIALEFYTQLWYNDIKFEQQNMDENRINIYLKPLEVIETNCEASSFSIFSGFIVNGNTEGLDKLTKFELTELKTIYEK